MVRALHQLREATRWYSDAQAEHGAAVLQYA